MASAQMQQKGAEEKTSPSAHGQGSGATSKGQSEKGAQQSEPRGKSSAQRESGQSSEKGTKGTERSQSKEQDTKGAERSQSKEQGTKGAERSQSKEQGTKGSARTEPGEHGTKGAQTEQSGRKQPTDQTAKGGSREGSNGRVQLSEQQRTNLHESIHKERNVNRVDRVNFSVNVGTRVPRSVRLAVLPAAVISLVPQYRSYRYFVVNDEICIVDPNTYEIVDVVSGGSRTARGQEPGGMARLTLSPEEKRIILDNVDMRGDSTLALGSLNEGSSVPRGVRLESFPDAVVQQVPKVRGYKYFTSEDRVAIVDPQGTKVQLVIDAKN
jgi:hypothetical protein